jgi:hypothetical protein
MKKTDIDSVMSALCAYTKVSATSRRLLKRQLCTNPCIDHVVHKLLNTDESRREYETLFSIVSPREMSSVISEADSSRELRGAVDYHIHGIELLRKVPDAQVDYMTRLFFKLASAVHPYYLNETSLSEETALAEFETVAPAPAPAKPARGLAPAKRSAKFAVRSPPPPRNKKIR